MKDEMTARQALGRCFCALCVPVTLVCAARPWPQVLGASACVCVIYIIMYKLRSAPLTALYREALGAAAKPALLLTALWTLLAAADTALRSGAVYGGAPQAKFCAPVILLLALWTLWHPTAGAQCAAVLTPALAAGFAAFLLSALPQLEPAWITPPPVGGAGAECFSVLLLPTALLFLPTQKPIRSLLPLAALLAVPPLVSAVTVGVLGAEVARQDAFAFYTLSESLSLFSVIERFEPLVSALSFAAFYVLATLLLESAAHTAASIFPHAKQKPLAALCAAAALALIPIAALLPQMVFVLSRVLFWGFLPIGALLLVAAKKDEKNLKKVVDKGSRR